VARLLPAYVGEAVCGGPTAAGPCRRTWGRRCAVVRLRPAPAGVMAFGMVLVIAVFL
jgi:hypothetical protein